MLVTQSKDEQNCRFFFMNIKKAIPLTLIAAIAFNGQSHSQECRLIKTYSKDFFLREGSDQSQLYDAVRNDTINDQIVLITSFALSGGFKAVHITFDSSNNAAVVKLDTRDSSVGVKNIFFSDTSRNHLFDKNQRSGFYSGICPDYNYHLTEILIISNPKNKKWIEVTTFNVNIKELLNKLEGFEYFKQIIEKINSVDLGNSERY